MAILWYFWGLVPWCDFPSVHWDVLKANPTPHQRQDPKNQKCLSGLEFFYNNKIENVYYLFLVPVFPRYMSTNAIFAFESFFTVGTAIAEMSREVNALDMVPDIVHVGVLLATQCAGVSSLATLRSGLPQVLVKHRPAAPQS